MKIKTFLKNATMVALLSGACVAANAAVTPVGPVVVGVPATFGGFAPTGLFSDIFTFSVPANGGSGYSVANFSPVGLEGSFITLLTSMSLISNPNGIPLDFDDTFVTSSTVPGGSAITMTWGPTAAGDMYLIVSGATTGSIGGIYTGAISVTAVPEPESYAMLLAGLGVMGAIAVRRNKAKKQG